jgi:hypothetical protein
MLAKDLAKILLKNPDAQVVHFQYIGCDTPLLEINEVHLEKKGTKTSSLDGGHFIHKDGTTKCDIVILTHDSNK